VCQQLNHLFVPLGERCGGQRIELGPHDVELGFEWLALYRVETLPRRSGLDDLQGAIERDEERKHTREFRCVQSVDKLWVDYAQVALQRDVGLPNRYAEDVVIVGIAFPLSPSDGALQFLQLKQTFEETQHHGPKPGAFGSIVDVMDIVLG
jgi:hypothetical protein